ncbi:Methyltransferase domain-containing protein [Prauserella aidingensis]|uniref:class I SAM-dependent methyltransferase n=1 Tax=Prauserella aidingensis TaxID=387890 RepID=UPI0020A44C6A|nr:class I SAM-dependent methyltransferase [Prauserella aidingensis]MCP2255104.1 Methyltransferase domain-containing protein [Prauserella aidingensis]
MPDAIFADPRLATLYDTFDGPRDDIPLYVAIADELGARRVLDVGCGTGEPAVALAAGREVVGVDPAEASLDIARGKSTDVTWLCGSADVVPAQLPEFRADLAVMTGNVAQVFLTDEDWHRTLGAIHDALRPGGHLAFETRRPEARAWERWSQAPAVTRDVPGVGTVTGQLTVTDVDLPLVSFRHMYRFPDGTTLASDSTLRFRDHDEITTSLHSAGFDVTDVRDAPDRPGMEYVFVTQRADIPEP